MIPETILVGISNVDRKRDFTYPTQNKTDKEDFPSTGRSEFFIQSIKEELQPLIEKNYHTNEVRALIGQSLGGLLATEILLKQPDLFTNYIIVSPSLWWDDQALLKVSPSPSSNVESVYIAVGKEGKLMEKLAKQLYKKIKKLKQKNTHLYFKFLKKRDHGDALHLAVYDAFERIFSQKE